MKLNRQWSNHGLFLLASIGSTVGLSNIWKFTYLVGENGGGAFVLIYIASLMLLGVPVLTAEMMMGKMGGQSMVGTLIKLGKAHGFSPYWRHFGWLANLSVFLILSFYCVIAGITIDYTVMGIATNLPISDANSGIAYYDAIMANPWRLMLFQGVFVLATTLIVARGVKKGLESSIRWMMPALFILLLALLVYAIVTADFMDAVAFMFVPEFDKITPTIILVAFGQAFFSLGIGLGVMLTYGAYMPAKSSVAKSALTIASADGLIAILAGLTIFPIVFQYNLSPAEGPGLIFMTLPIAFSQMPGGQFIGPLFFILLAFAALSSSISLLESVIARIEELARWSRKRIVYWAGFLLWLFGLLTVFSFNIWADFTPFDAVAALQGKTIFGLIDYFASNLVMPLGGILMAIMAGWFIDQNSSREHIGINQKLFFQVWLILVRFIAPAVVLLIFISNL